MNDRFIREPERKQTTGISKTTWWRLEQKGYAPKRFKLSPNAIGWLESDIKKWMQSRTETP